MANKVYVKCKYWDGYVYPSRHVINDRLVLSDNSRIVDHVVYGEFLNVSWDGQARKLVLKAPKINICIEEFDHQYSGTEPCEEHVSRCIEYLVIDDMVIIDEREESN